MANRVNRAIELLQSGQPVYYGVAEDVSYEGGVAAARTWLDYITVEMEHHAFDVAALHAFMRGLVAGGPTPSGHRTPAVVVTLPATGASVEEVRANAWMVKQVLAAGVHGILLCHAESPEAVGAFVEAARFPFQKAAVGEGLGEGRRGAGGQGRAAEIWGLTAREYLDRADVWPLNPQGELMLGLKIENRRALARVEESTKVPGIAFAEWGPGDMGMSFGYPDQHDEPYPPEMLAARARVLAACMAASISFLDGVWPHDYVARLEEGVRIVNPRGSREVTEAGRKHTGRTMPWA